jgi:hypothetical protein
MPGTRPGMTIPKSSLPGLTRQSMRLCRTFLDSAWTTGSSPVVTKWKITSPLD